MAEVKIVSIKPTGKVKPGDSLTLSCELRMESGATGNRNLQLFSDAFKGPSKKEIFSAAFHGGKDFSVKVSEEAELGKEYPIKYKCWKPGDERGSSEGLVTGVTKIEMAPLPKVSFADPKSGLTKIAGEEDAYQIGKAKVTCKLSDKAPHGGAKATLTFAGEDAEVTFEQGATSADVEMLFGEIGTLKLVAESGCDSADELTELDITIKSPVAGIEGVADFKKVPGGDAYQVGSAKVTVKLSYPAVTDVSLVLSGDKILKEAVKTGISAGEQEQAVPINLLDTGAEEVKIILKPADDDQSGIQIDPDKKETAGLIVQVPTIGFAEDQPEELNGTTGGIDLLKVKVEFDYLPPEPIPVGFKFVSDNIQEAVEQSVSDRSNLKPVIELDASKWKTAGLDPETDFKIEAVENCVPKQDHNSIPLKIPAFNLTITEIWGMGVTKPSGAIERYENAPFYYGDKLHFKAAMNTAAGDGGVKFKVIPISGEEELPSEEVIIDKGEREAADEHLVLEHDTLKNLSTKADVFLKIEPLEGKGAGHDLESLIDEGADKKRRFEIHPFPKVSFDSEEPIEHGREKVIEDSQKPAEKYYYPIIADKQKLKLMLSAPLPQQKVKIDLNNALKGSGDKRFDILKDKPEPVFDSGITELSGIEVKFQDTAHVKRSPKNIEAKIKARSDDGTTWTDVDDPEPSKLRLKYEKARRTVLYWGTDWCSHAAPENRLVASRDQVWIRMYREGKADPLPATSEDITLKCSAFSEGAIPVVFEEGERVSKWLTLSSDHLKGLTVLDTTGLSGGRVVPGRYKLKVECSRRKFSKKFGGDQHFDVQSRRYVYFSMDTLAAFEEVEAGKTLDVDVRLTIPAGVHNRVRLHDGLRNIMGKDYLIRFGFGQFQTSFPVQFLDFGEEKAHMNQLELIPEEGVHICDQEELFNTYPYKCGVVDIPVRFKEVPVKGFKAVKGKWRVSREGEIPKVTVPSGEKVKLQFDIGARLPLVAKKKHKLLIRSEFFKEPVADDKAVGDDVTVEADRPYCTVKLRQDEKGNYYEVKFANITHIIRNRNKVPFARTAWILATEEPSSPEENDAYFDKSTGKVNIRKSGSWEAAGGEVSKGTLLCDLKDNKYKVFNQAGGDLEPKGDFTSSDIIWDNHEEQFQVWNGSDSKWEDLPEDVRIVANITTKQYAGKFGDSWQNHGCMAPGDLCIDGNEYHAWKKGGESYTWSALTESGDVAEGDVVIDLSAEDGQGYFKRNSSGGWEDLVPRKELALEVALINDKPGTGGQIAFESDQLNCGALEERHIDVLVETPTPVARFAAGESGMAWIRPPIREFAVGDRARVFIRFSKEVSTLEAGEDEIIPIVGKGVAHGSVESPEDGDICVDAGNKIWKYKAEETRWEEAGKPEDEKYYRNRAEGKNIVYQFVEYEDEDPWTVAVDGGIVGTFFRDGFNDDSKVGEPADVYLIDEDDRAEDDIEDLEKYEISTLGYAEIEFADDPSARDPGKRKRFRRWMRNQQPDLIFEDFKIYIVGRGCVANNFYPLSTLVGVHDKRIVRIERDTALESATFINSGNDSKQCTTDLTIKLNIPAPLYGARVKLKGAGGFFKTAEVPVKAEGSTERHPDYADYEKDKTGEDMVITIPEGRSQGKVRIEFTADTGSDGKEIELEKVTDTTAVAKKAYCEPATESPYKPKIVVGAVKAKALTREIIPVPEKPEDAPNPVVGQAIRLVLTLVRAAPDKCTAVITCVDGESFEDSEITVPEGETTGEVDVVLKKATGSEAEAKLKIEGDNTKYLQDGDPAATCKFTVDSKYPIQVKAAVTGGGTLKIGGDYKGNDFEGDVDKLLVVEGAVEGSTKINFTLKNINEGERHCALRSGAFGARVYNVNVPGKGEATVKTTVSAKRSANVHLFDPANRSAKLSRRSLIRIDVAPTSSTSTCHTPVVGTVTGTRGTSTPTEEEIPEQPCNFHHLKLTVKRNGDPVKDRGDDGAFYVATQKTVVAEQTSKPLICGRNKFPVLQVVAGKSGEVYTKDADRKHHETSIEVDVSQPEGFPFCNQEYLYAEGKPALAHPIVVVKERYSKKPHLYKEIGQTTGQDSGEKKEVEFTRSEAGVGRLLDPCIGNPTESGVQKRREKCDEWFYYDPTPLPGPSRNWHDETEGQVDPVSFRVYRADQRWLGLIKKNSPEQYLVQAQCCGAPDTKAPGLKAGPTENLHAIIEVYPSVEHCLKIGGAPDSVLYSLGHEGDFFDPKEGFDPEKGFDPGLKKGLKSVKKAAGEAEDSPPPPIPESPFKYEEFLKCKELAEQVVVPDRVATSIEAPENPDMQTHIDFYNSIKIPQAKNRLLAGVDSDFIWYPVDDQKPSLRLPQVDIVKHALMPFLPEDGAWVEEESGAEFLDTGRAKTESEFGEAWDDTFDWAEYKKQYREPFDSSSKLSDSERAEEIISKNWFGYLPKIHAARNGKPCAFFEGAEYTLNVLKTAQSIAAFVLSIANNIGDTKFAYGFGFNFKVGFMEGELLAYWGWKECGDQRVFPWHYTAFNCKVLSVELEGNFSVGFAFHGMGVAAMLYLKLGVAFDADFTLETKPYDQTERPETIKKITDVDLTVEGGLKAFAISDAILSLTASISSGIKFRMHWYPSFGTQVHHLGIIAKVEIALVFTKKEFDWKIAEPQDTDTPVYCGRGSKDPTDESSLWYAQHRLTLAGALLEKFQRRLKLYFRQYQTLQLNIFMAGGHPPRTFDLPGHEPRNPNGKWVQNRDKWVAQWGEVVAAFEKETHEVRGRNTVRRYQLKDRLEHKADRIERFLDDFATALRALERTEEKQRDYEERLTEAQKNKATLGNSQREQMIRMADQQFEKVKSQTGEKLVYGKKNKWTYSKFQSLVKDMHFYALKRKRW